MRRQTLVSMMLVGLALLVGATPALAEKSKRGVSVMPSVQAGSLAITGEYWALIVGIDQYQHVPQLQSAVRDAQALREVLVQRYGFARDHVFEIINGQATREGIENALYQLRKKAGKDDSVFIYYAGHGQIDQEDQIGYWVPVEGKAQSPGTFISNARIRDEIARMKARHVYLVADSCFSGTLFASGRALPPLNDKFFQRLYANKSRWGLTSGMNEPVTDQGKDGHSMFAYFLLKLLKENDEPYLVPSHIYDQIAPLIGRNTDQQPRSEPLQNAGDEGGQFVFRLVSASGGPVPTVKQHGPELAASGDSSSAEMERMRAELESLKAQITKPKIDELKSIEVAKAPTYESPRTLTKEINGRDGSPMALIPGGSFWMGGTREEMQDAQSRCIEVFKAEICTDWMQAEAPRHQVTLDSFYVDRYEVTNRLFQAFVQSTGYETSAERQGVAKVLSRKKGIISDTWEWQDVNRANWRKPQGDDTITISNHSEHPVVSVSWEDANAYCRHYGKRLPTEAEWEYAARAATHSRYWWGDEFPTARRVANLLDEAAKRQFPGHNVLFIQGYDDNYSRTAPVGSFEANPWGLHDIIGNVGEWTADWYDAQYYQHITGKNPQGPSKNTGSKAVRGGNWQSGLGSSRAAFRWATPPQTASENVGFRCAQDAR